MSSPRQFALVSLIVVLAAGCGSGDDTATPATTTRSAVTTTTRAAPSGPLDAGVRQYREDEAAGVLQIQLRNVGEEPMRVETLRLAWDGLEPTPDATPHYPLGAGVTVDLPVPIGRAVCHDGAGDDPSAATAVVGVTRADGQPATLAVAVTDGFEVLARLHERMCTQQEVTDAVDIASGDTFTATPGAEPPAAAGSLVLTRRNDATDEITVTKLTDGGVLLDMSAASPVVTLGPGDHTANGEVTVVSSGRCDAHALGESKKTYEFRAELEIGGEPHVVDLQIPLAAQPALKDVIDRTCS